MSSRAQYSSRNQKLAYFDMSYRDYLESDMWLECKDFISNNARYKDRFALCSICKAVREHLHHIKYSNLMHKNIKQRLMYIEPLCKDCHNKVHKVSAQNPSKGLKWCTRKTRKLRSQTPRQSPTSICF